MLPESCSPSSPSSLLDIFRLLGSRGFVFSAGFAALLLAVVGACGGSAAQEPKSAESAQETSEESSSEAEPEEEETAEESPPRASCEDGTCFMCGTSTCLSGWYCDQSAKGGAACSWVPECVKKPSCGCLKKTLGAGCACEERDGGPHVTCS